MKFKHLFIFSFLIFLLFSFSVQAQSEKIQAYREELKKADNDSIKSHLHYKVAVQYRKTDYDKAIKHGELALGFGKDGGNLIQQANALQLIGLIYKYKGDYPTALHYYDQSYKKHNEAGNKEGMATIMNNKGVVYKNTGKLDSALAIYDKADSIYRSANNEEGIAKLAMNRGIVMKHKGAYEDAAEYYIQALRIYEKLDNKASVSRCYNNLGVLYRAQDLPEQALEYYRKALKINKEQEAMWSVARCYVYIGSVWGQNFGQNDSSLHYYDKGLEIFKNIGERAGVANIYMNKSNTYQGMGDIDKALYFMLKADTLSKEIGKTSLLLYTTSSLGTIYSKLGQHKKAIRYIEKSLEMAEEAQEMRDILSAYKQLAYAYKRKGDPDRAFDYLKTYYSKKDSISGTETKSRIAELQTMYESEKKENEIAMLKKKEELQSLALRKKQVVNYAFMGGLALVLVLAFFIFRNYRQKKKHAAVLEDQNSAISRKNAIIEEKNKDVTDSIRYAKRLQDAIIPSGSMISSTLPDSFVLYKPKDIVSGDFYWMKQIGNDIFYAVVDCTGHGVPGAFMSIVGHNGLNNAFIEQKIRKPSAILDKLNDIVEETLNTEKKTSIRDGMDAALCKYTPGSMKLEFAGAMNPLYLIRNDEFREVKGDKHAIGGARDLPGTDFTSYTNHEIALQKGDLLYIFTDGFADQFGGKKGKKFKYGPFKELLMEMKDEPLTVQREKLNRTIETWRGELEQVDDICVMGVKV